jgi:hypothetical protein
MGKAMVRGISSMLAAQLNGGLFQLRRYCKRPYRRSCYKHYTPDDFRAIFVSEYQRIEPTSKLVYNKERNPMTPSWQYIAKMLGVDTWVKLKTVCGVNYPNKRKGERSFIVTSQILGISEDLKKRSPYKR